MAESGNGTKKKANTTPKEKRPIDEKERKGDIGSSNEKDKNQQEMKIRRHKEPHELTAAEIRRHQFVPLILIVAALLVTISYLLVEKSGVFGQAVKYVFYGLFGPAAYAIPVLLVIAAVNWQKYLLNRKIKLNLLLFAVTLICLSSFFEIIALTKSAEDPGWSISVKNIFLDGVAIKSGGVIGGVIGIFFRNIFGSVGSFIVIIAGITVLLLALFGATPVSVAMFLADLIRRKIEESREERKSRAVQSPKIERTRKNRANDEDDGTDDLNDDPEEESVKIVPPPKKSETSQESEIGSQEEDDDRDKYPPVKVKIVREKLPAEDTDDRSDVAADFPPKRTPKHPVPTEYERTLGNESGDALDELQNTLDISADERKNADSAEDVEQIGLADDIAEFDTREIKPVPKKVRKSVRELGDTSDLSDITGDLGPDPLPPVKIDRSGIEKKENTAEGTVSTPSRSEEPQNEEPLKINPYENYKFPPLSLLTKSNVTEQISDEEIHSNIKKLMDTLTSFKIRVSDITCSCGPTITRYEVKPESGVRVRSIANLVDDIALGLAKSGVRIEAPIPGKSAVGIEVPNDKAQTVYLRSLIESKTFTDMKSRVSACLGADVGGRPITLDVAKMPHLLVAGATGMGKSVCINSIIVSILYKARADEVKLILIDPKKVEFGIYKDIPHLFVPIITDPKKAAGTLASAVNEMERRFAILEQVGVKDLAKYNEVTKDDPDMDYLPQIVIIIDELADLMMTAADEVETYICRITQKARAAGIHLIIGTQRPSVDVITGLIKSNIPSRIAFTVASQVDSRTIIDIAGAEKLIGRGDMLYAPVGSAKPIRVQGAFVSEEEVESVSSYLIRFNGRAIYNSDFQKQIESEAEKCGAGKKGASYASDPSDSDEFGADGEDSKLRSAVDIALTENKISTSLLQRKLQIGYGRAAKIIDRMQELGIVSAPDGNKPRQIRITREQFDNMISNNEI